MKSILNEPVIPVDNTGCHGASTATPRWLLQAFTESARAKPAMTSWSRRTRSGKQQSRILGETEGLVKVIAEEGPDGTGGRILGIHMVGPWVTEQLGQGYLAINWEATVDEVAQFIQPHPTFRKVSARPFSPSPEGVCTLADVTMPQLGETVTEGTITRWLKQVAESVERDEPLFEVSTDKVDSEVPSPAGGVVAEIRVPEGETVDVGTFLRWFRTLARHQMAPRSCGSSSGSRSRCPLRHRQRRRRPRPVASPPPPSPAAPAPAAPAPARLHLRRQAPFLPPRHAAGHRPPQVPDLGPRPFPRGPPAHQRTRDGPFDYLQAQDPVDG